MSRTNFYIASAESEAQKQNDITEAHRVYREGVERLHATRPESHGSTAAMDAIAREEAQREAELAQAGDWAVRQAEQAHRGRVAAAGAAHGIIVEPV